MKLFSPGAKRKELNTPYFLANPGLDTPKTSISKLNSNHPAYQDFQVSGRKNGHLQEIWCKEQTARQTWNTWLHLHDSTKSGPNYGQLSGIYLGDHDMFGASCPPTLKKKNPSLYLELKQLKTTISKPTRMWKLSFSEKNNFNCSNDSKSL